jgi:hypothetical protein
MLENTIGRLPVVDRKDPREMVGYINRANVMGSWRGHRHEESVRDHVWLRDLKSIPENRGNRSVAIGRVDSLTDDQLLLTPNSHPSGPAEEFALNAPVGEYFWGMKSV